MKQLGVLDTAFVNLETGPTPQHIGGLSIYDPSTAPDGFVRFKQVLASFDQRLSRLPIFRQRLVEVPGGLDRPYWIEDERFNIEYHLRHVALPAPGDWRQLMIQVARLHSRPLDMSRPLWECYVIEGLDNISELPKGLFAVYTKMHHALIDGAGSEAFMSALHDLVPNPEPRAEEERQPVAIEKPPGPMALVGRALVNRTVNTASMARGFFNVTRDVAKMAIDISRDKIPMPDIRPPQTRLNKPVGPYRVVEGVAIPLKDFMDIRTRAEVKMNDVVLTVIGGALRKYLLAYDDLPEESLTGSVPINMRKRRAENDEANQVGSVFSKLHTNIADPLERMRAIKASMDDAKVFTENSPLADGIKLPGVFSPMIARPLARAYSEKYLCRFLPMSISTVISNVPGPNFPLYCAGAQLVRFYGLGLLTPGTGLFHLVFSYNGMVTITILADRGIVPDPAFYRQCLEESFREVQQAVLGEQPKRAGRKKSAAAGRVKKPRASSKKKTAGRPRKAAASA
ncbi:MAG: wax ester/triacylglycerol synthase family O-acyltransferase [Halioglobus sp.]|nr:wax ester/triacylglycerol synthase family O-acyltransferase [Halioglobus sp.]